MKINYLISKGVIENKEIKLTEQDLENIFKGKPIKGFMFNNYSNIIFLPEECMELDLYKKNIEKLDNVYKKALAFILIRRAMVRKMPYSRFNLNWDKITQLRDEAYSYKMYGRKRAYHNLSFKEHILENYEDYNNAVFDNEKTNIALNLNIFDAISSVETDAIYLDPPYTGTMNNYFGFYGVLDEYICGKKLQPFKDNFIDNKQAVYLFERLFVSLRKFKYILLSYNNSSFPTKEQILALLKKCSREVSVIEKKHAYQLTGKNNKKKNLELLFIAKTK